MAIGCKFPDLVNAVLSTANTDLMEASDAVVGKIPCSSKEISTLPSQVYNFSHKYK